MRPRKDNQTVLLAHPGAELYGADRMLAVTAQALSAAGKTVIVVIPEKGPLHELLVSRNVNVVVLRIAVVRKRVLSPLRILGFGVSVIRGTYAAAQLIERLSPDVIYINTVTQPSWQFAAHFRRISTVVHVRENESGMPWVVQRGLLWPFRLADTVVSNSDSTAEFVQRNLPKSKAKRVTIYNGKDWTELEKIEIKSASELYVGLVKLLVVGRISPRKGQDIAISVAAELNREGVATQLTFAGDVFPGYEWFEAELEKLAEDAGITDRVKKLGFVSNISATLSDADIVLVPSRQEPFGTVALEAMVGGRTVVMSAVEGLLEIQAVCGHGFLADATNVSSFVDAIKRLILDRELAARSAKAARAAALFQFSEVKYSAAICGLIESVVKEQASVRPR